MGETERERKQTIVSRDQQLFLACAGPFFFVCSTPSVPPYLKEQQLPIIIFACAVE